MNLLSYAPEWVVLNFLGPATLREKASKKSKLNMPTSPDFDHTFQQLKDIFEPYRSRLVVSADNNSLFTLEVDHVMKNKSRLYFGGVRKGKAYVSFHLMPVYACPEVKSQISPELKKRMQR